MKQRASVRLISTLFILVCVLPGCGLIARQATIVYMAVDAHFSPKEIAIEINKSFIERYKNRVTLDAVFTIDKAMGSPLPDALDGDLHFAGRSPQVALPLIGEIANADDAKEAVHLVHDAADTGKPLRVSGAWRMWAEHAGEAVEKQGNPLPAFDTYRPEHVFEIHPITRINGIDLLHTFRPVKGFSPGGAARTFAIYERASFRLKVNPGTVSIVTETGLYNDVEFIMEVAADPQLVVADGRFVIASARGLHGNLHVERLRTVFVRGTPPESAVKLLKRGDRLHVWGIPRLDLAEISRRVRGAGMNPAVLSGPLPYEIIIIGAYADGK